MNDIILGYIKEYIGIASDNSVFDSELLSIANTTASILSQLGVQAFDGLTIGPTTEWPDFVGDDILENMCKTHMSVRVSTIFDPTASATIAQVKKVYISELEFRIQSQVETDVSRRLYVN